MTDNEEINKALARPLALTAGFLGLVQGIAWFVMSILALLTYNGSITIDIQTENVTTYQYYEIIYLMFLEEDSTLSTGIITPNEFSIFMWFYLIISAIWTIESGAVVWAMIRSKWSFAKTLFGSWAILSVTVSIVDIVFTGILAKDYSDYNRQVTQVSVCYGLVMSLAARGYILLIINIIFAMITLKFAIDIYNKENATPTIPFINGYENNNVNPPWFSNDVKDFWASPQHNSNNAFDNVGYDRGFERSASFYPVSLPPEPDYTPPPTASNYAPPPPPTEPTSFAEAIAQKTATIGKKKGRRSPPNNVPPPFIPEPDYTPPNSPNALKSVLKSKSNY